MERWIIKCRDGLISVLENESLFLLAAILLRSILFVDPLKWHMDELTRLYTYMLCPWGGMLIGFRLFRARSMNITPPREMLPLFLLFVWIVFPMLFRFGVTFNNAVTDIGYAIVFFGVYAGIRERTTEVRRKRLFEMGVLFTILAIIWGGLLLYCAFTGRVFGKETGGVPFGVRDGLLFAGVHYNSVGMMAIGCLFMSLALFECTRWIPLRVAGILAGMIIVLVIILSQSRSTRYAMLMAFAFGVFFKILSIPFNNRLVQKGVAVVAAATILIGGFLISNLILNVALNHYSKLSAGKMDAVDETNLVSEASQFVAQSPRDLFFINAQAEGTMTGEARVAIDATFSDRTNVWRNLFDLWKSDIKKMFIGRGVGNTGSLIAHGTTHEEDGTAAAHNTFLQFIADFGLIGLVLQFLFFLYIFPDAIRGFKAGAEKTAPGNLSMGMMVVAILAIGMMESAPLGQMTPTNLMLYTALAFLTAEGHEILVNRE